MRLSITRLLSLIDDAVLSPVPGALQGYCDMPYYVLMYMLSQAMAPCTAVELGVYKGQGCLALAFGSPQTRVYGVESERRKEIADLERMAPNFTFVGGSSLPVPASLIGKEISILHIDTAHAYAQARDEFLGYRPYLVDGAVVLFDDLHAMSDAVLRAFMEQPYWKVQDDRLHPICGYGVLMYER